VGGGSGAVINTGTLTLFRTAVVDSGGVFSSAVESSGGLVTIAQCLFSGDNGGLSWPALAINGGEAHISRTMFTKGNQDGPSSLSVSALASVAVYDSAFVNNFGGVLDNAGDLIITNTTFTGNRFTSFFGGSVISNTGRLTVRSSTFADNGFGSVFGGVFGLVVNIASSVAPAVTTVVNTILVHDGIVNTKDCVSELGGKITSLGHNLVTDATGCGQIPSDLIGDAGLGALVDNGIPGNAHLDLLSGSRAINAADSAACPKTDQIGQRRLPHCDIGAVEFKKSAQHNDADEHEHDSPGLWQDLD
jgi:hypothetical protein